MCALDPATRETLVPELAARLRETETATVIVTHDATEAFTLGDRLLVLVDGRIAQWDRMDAVLAQGDRFPTWSVEEPERQPWTQP